MLCVSQGLMVMGDPIFPGSSSGVAYGVLTLAG